ncbi:MAG: DUF1592 domain-containing protein [Myxococcota bacterium]
MSSRIPTSALLFLSVAAFGCRQELGRPDSSFELNPVEEVGGPSDGSPDPGTSDSKRPSCDYGADRVRRLSNREYLNALHDLFPGVSVPDVELPVPASPKGFDNDATTLAVGPSDFDAQLTIMESFAPEAADYALSRVDCAGQSVGVCGQRFVEYWSLRIFRRPFPLEKLAEFVDLFVEAGSTEVGGALALQSMLMAPEFIYRLERSADDPSQGVVQADGYTMAERLAFLIWEGPPDDELLLAAEQGRLDSAEELQLQAERMLEDAKARRPIETFFFQWLQLDHIDDANKNPEDGLTGALRDAMKEQTLRTLDHLVFERGASFGELLSSNETFVNRELAQLYGLEPVEGWSAVELDSSERRGVLTHASFLAAHGHPNYPSPVLRGAYVMDVILCQPTGEPPPDAQDASPDIGSQTAEVVTNRDRYEVSTSEQGATCFACHQFINPLGYAFEQFDTMGRYRTDDNGAAIDATGAYRGLVFDGAADLIGQLVESPDVQRCATSKYLTYALGGQEVSGSECLASRVEQSMAESGGTVRDFFTALVSQPEFSQVRLESSVEDK